MVHRSLVAKWGFGKMPFNVGKAHVMMFAICFLFLGVFLGIREIRRAGEAEKNLHAIICVAHALEQFVDYYGEWPVSWNELIAMEHPVESPSMYQLPRDVAEIKNRVDIRFDFDPLRTSNECVDKLISPKGPCYHYDKRLNALCASIRKRRPKATD